MIMLVSAEKTKYFCTQQQSRFLCENVGNGYSKCSEVMSSYMCVVYHSIGTSYFNADIFFAESRVYQYCSDI